MDSNLKNPRKRKPNSACPICGINMSCCICDNFKKMKTMTRIDLVIHYKELKRTSNSGRLIEPLLTNQRIWVRGRKDEALDHSKVLNPVYTPLLLYPSEDAMELSEEKIKEFKSKKPFQIIVPDGNWRQASKVHYRVDEFKSIPRVTLKKGLADRERLLRKESKEEGMSTLEAIAHVMSYFESDLVKDHLLNAYQLKKKTQQKMRGSDKFR